MRNSLLIIIFTISVHSSCSRKEQEETETEKMNRVIVHDAKKQAEKTEATLDSIMSTVDLESALRMRKESKRFADSLEKIKQVIRQPEK